MAKTQIFENYSEFITRADKSINGVSADFAKEHGIELNSDEGNVGCWECINCTRCSNCIYCKNCLRCTDCKNCDGCEECKDLNW